MKSQLIDSMAFSSRSKAILLISIFVLVIAGAYASWILEASAAFYITGGWFILVAALLWWGNKFINSKFDKILPWKRWGNFRFFILLTLGLVYLLIVINISYILLKVTVTEDPPTPGQIVVTNVLGAGIFIPLFSIYFSLYFLRHWRRSELEGEKMQKENIRSQLNLLRTQLDPHFLFNNLNILSALIDTDTGKSKEFVAKLADVYRALMKRNPEDLTVLSEELKFLDAYVFLLKTRFGQFLRFNIDIPSGLHDKMLPPLTLQLLVENAIKHNLLDEQHPLTIEITKGQSDYLTVKNSLRTTSVQPDRKGTGLDNIRQRYAYFTDQPVEIIQTETTFQVNIPLLTLENT